MEQRASALQARLEARRNMFLKTDNNATYGVNNKPATTATNSGRTPTLHIKMDLNISRLMMKILTKTFSIHPKRQLLM